MALAAWGSARHAAADTLIINRPGYHQRYIFEAEPHLLAGFIDAPGAAHGTGFGVGFRGTVQVLENGFVPSINNSIGVGFGMDWVHYGLGDSYCTSIDLQGRCQRYSDNRAVDTLWVPVVLQWNFWLSRNWSVFGEPGLALRYEGNTGGDHRLHPEFLQLFVGGRYHFSDNVTLTMRLGYPTFSVGVSFLL
ncbi:MAG: hypothetical protein QM756_06160 [Polyangiaceae bacterium]